MKRFALVAVLSALALPAFAADLPRRQGQQTFKPSTLPAFTWTGFYVGANAGAGWGKFTRDARRLDARTGFVGGGTVGYNHQIGNFVASLEGDYNYSGVQGKDLGVKGSLTSFGTVRGRLGMAFDRALVYGTGGYALGFGKVLAPGFVNDSKMHQGYVVGGGVEYAFTQNISAKAEYLYMPLGKATYVGPAGAAAQAGLNTNIVRAGVNYRF